MELNEEWTLKSFSALYIIAGIIFIVIMVGLLGIVHLIAGSNNHIVFNLPFSTAMMFFVPTLLIILVIGYIYMVNGIRTKQKEKKEGQNT